MTRIVAVEDGEAGAVNELIVGAVVQQDDAGWGEDGCRAGFSHTRVELSGTDGEHGRVERLGPVDEVGGVDESGLIGLVGGGAEKIHPVLAVDFYGHDGSRLRPADVPFALIGRP